MSAPGIVFVLWWITLAVVVLIVLPILIVMLHRTFRVARQIERYMMQALEAGVGVAGETANTAALTSTISVATDILGVAGAIEADMTTIESVLAARAGGAA